MIRSRLGLDGQLFRRYNLFPYLAAEQKIGARLQAIKGNIENGFKIQKKCSFDCST